MEKQGYISPQEGKLEISVVRDAQPRVDIALDLGIPNFTVFSMRLPLVEDDPRAMSGLVAEAVHVLCDEVASFMLSMQFEEEVIVRLYATVLAAYKAMAKGDNKESGDDMVKTFEVGFRLPQEFVDETQKKVVTAAKVVQRTPKTRHLELTYAKPSKTTVDDTARVVRQYRNRTLRQQPRPLYVVVYDQLGRPQGAVPVDPNFKNKLLQMTRKRGSVEFGAPVSYTSEQEMRSTPISGMPSAISVGGFTYLPEAVAGADMALYHGPQDWLVKFPDGSNPSAAVFPKRPIIPTLRKLGLPVPLHRFNWTTLPKEEGQ